MLKISTLSFPGLGIGEFDVNSVAFTLFGRDVAWYGLIITTGILLAVAYVMLRAREARISTDDIIDLALIVIPSAIICARLYYVLTKLDHFHSAWDVIAIWEGGIAIYGAIIGGGIAAYFVARHKKIPVMKLLDILAPAVLIGQIVGRWGNFMNAEAYGYATDLPWRMGIHNWYGGVDYVHPTFLYESLWNLIGFILIQIFWRKRQYNGQTFLFYITWYGFGRFFVEGLRTDSLYLGATGIRISQLVGALCFLIGGALLVYFARRPCPALRLDPVAVADGEAVEASADDKNKEESENGADN